MKEEDLEALALLDLQELNQLGLIYESAMSPTQNASQAAVEIVKLAYNKRKLAIKKLFESG